jgi:hypothetical protein
MKTEIPLDKPLALSSATVAPAEYGIHRPVHPLATVHAIELVVSSLKV